MRVGVIDYGVGNLGSVMRALEELRVTPVLITRAIDIHTVDSLILPGVGNFADCAQLLDEGGWAQALRDEVQTAGKPLLGVCLGMQLLASSSMEGVADNAIEATPGLGFIPGRVENLRTLGCSLRIPHVGWNGVASHTASGGLFDGIPDGTDFYFVHSYAFVPDDPAHVLATTEYGITVTAAVRCGHIWGTQFHPEKSSRAGFRLLRNFIENPTC
ncbi:MAG: imidazole glycerol phosphate synthase subunit HisH [Methylobacter sp.]|nr:imidazole glycerol phosphate synthase subunit HisH [Methylobacter sp.]MDP2097069.1 imidazole glycerol phosphate synthase subunit HisH [Methylobacter sp.]MDP2428007.1 imidazole glycerol phosphate synthase subunit HisH [Methylobacter sp.]MDP3055903.1 imidazole glycerol phosphate synthase subunit HisH [Methylobacter sp.]MDP3363061.1 imidazole glycerol phosphate synthase subunit HisH [Methylobacter sp.]